MAHGFAGSGLSVSQVSGGTAGAGSAINLRVTEASASTVTITADSLVLTDGTTPILISSVSETVDITVSGAGGLDTGSEASSTWYYIWIIRNSGTSDVSSLLSTASTVGGLTLPSGYDQYALVSAVRNTGGGDFFDFEHVGDIYAYDQWPILTSGTLGTGSWTSVSTADLIPSALSNFFFAQYLHASGAGVSNDSTTSVVQTTNSTGKFTMPASANFPFEMHIRVADTIYALSDNASFVVRVQGFRVNKLAS